MRSVRCRGVTATISIYRGGRPVHLLTRVKWLAQKGSSGDLLVMEGHMAMPDNCTVQPVPLSVNAVPR